MKMAMIAYNEAIDIEVQETLEHCGLTGYTKVVGAMGRGATSGTHLGNDIWPGLNNVLLVAMPDEKVPALLECVQSLRKSLGAEGVKAFVWTIEQMT